ncbi:MAG: hypothetical protein AAF384_04905, partial [Pseudomonadota bacterium]
TLPASVQACHDLFADNDQSIQENHSRDAQNYRVPNHPYLRTNRFLAAFSHRLDDQATRNAWIERMLALDRADREIELKNAGLPAPSGLARCYQDLAKNIGFSDDLFDAIVQNTAVPPSYNPMKRWLGAYPISSRFIRRQVVKLQSRENEAIDRFSAFADGANYRVYGKQKRLPVAKVPAPLPTDRLGIPMPSDQDLTRLFERHLPMIAVEQISEADQIGSLSATGSGLAVEVQHPSYYTLVSYTHFHGRVLLQLNYVWWFPKRGRASQIDIYAGKLDGLTWRVTLDTDLSVLAYDVMHNCGCYHMFFPSPRLVTNADNEEASEPLWLPPIQWPHSAPTIFLKGRSHYLAGVINAPNLKISNEVTLRPYDALRSLAVGARYRSAFGEGGLIKASRRLERFLLWPSGIASPGAMRQWGHHATAFVGQRHFDDPFLLARYFSLLPNKSSEKLGSSEASFFASASSSSSASR